MPADGPKARLRHASLPRRDFLAIGALGGIGLALPATKAVTAQKLANDRQFGRAKRALLLFLTGGSPQHDTWDMKPAAAADIRGEFKPISTAVPGVQICELFPKLAERMNKVRVVRSVSHGDTAHTSAGYTMLTGAVHPLAKVEGAGMARPTPDDLPHIGSWLAKAREQSEVLPFVSLPEVIKDANVNTFPGQDGGLLGQRYAPLRIDANDARDGFRLPQIVLPADVNLDRLADRRELLRLLASEPSELAASPAGLPLAGQRERAAELLASTAVQRAFAVPTEPERLRRAYGSHLFGQGCLLARRLLEAGVGLVTVYWHYEGPEDSPVWDTHWNNFEHCRQRLIPPTDQALSALLDDLASRGLLDDTLLIVMGEFGRTPKINGKAGRDHWPHVQSILLAGAGIPGGTVYGASDRDGAYPAERAVAPADLIATFLHLLGVPPELEAHDPAGRPFRAYSGTPLPDLVS
jgi:hypothetical protein